MEIGPVAFTLLAVATFTGALVQAASGFGFAIVAAPLYLAATGVTGSIPLLVLLHLVQSAMVVPQVWRDAPSATLGNLLVGAAFGCPLGLILFLFSDVQTLKLLVGVLILGVTVLILGRDRIAAIRGATAGATPLPEPPGDRMWSARLTGLVSGAMTSLLVMPGPPLMVWLMGTSTGKVQARALSLTFFAACYVAVSLLNIASGTVGRTIWWLAFLLAPTVVLGTIAGTRIVRHISEGWFRRVVLALLALSGGGAIVSALL